MSWPDNMWPSFRPTSVADRLCPLSLLSLFWSFSKSSLCLACVAFVFLSFRKASHKKEGSQGGGKAGREQGRQTGTTWGPGWVGTTFLSWKGIKKGENFASKSLVIRWSSSWPTSAQASLPLFLLPLSADPDLLLDHGKGLPSHSSGSLFPISILFYPTFGGWPGGICSPSTVGLILPILVEFLERVPSREKNKVRCYYWNLRVGLKSLSSLKRTAVRPS